MKSRDLRLPCRQLRLKLLHSAHLFFHPFKGKPIFFLPFQRIHYKLFTILFRSFHLRIITSPIDKLPTVPTNYTVNYSATITPYDTQISYIYISVNISSVKQT